VIGAVFLVVVAIVMFVQRRSLAQMQAVIFGGSILPGCVVAEAVALLALAAAIVVFERALR